ncbi:MAG: Gfo/Idh/MocA family protein [Bacteroidota bacterium]
MGNTSNYTSRRDFLKSFSTWVGASAVLSAVPWLQAVGNTPFNGEKVKLAVIGVGGRGSGLLANLLKIENVEVVAVCDNYEPHYKRALEMTEGKAKGYYDYRKLLEQKDIQGVVIATPLFAHAGITVDAFQAGKHVFCEKAMAMTYEECKAMYTAHKNAGKVMIIGHQRMFHPRYLHAYEMVQEGKLGQIGQVKAYWHRNNNWRRHVPSPELEKKINWRLYREFSHGLMTELASHHIQVANWFLNTKPLQVSGSGSITYWKDGREVYDNVNLVYRYPKGIHFVYDSMTSNKHYGLEISFMGDKGLYEMEKNKFYPEEIEPAPGIKQLINDIEHAVFDEIPIGGATWVPETASNIYGYPIINPDEDTVDETFLQLQAYANAVSQDKKEIPGIAEQGYYASIGTIMGVHAMRENTIVEWPEIANI